MKFSTTHHRGFLPTGENICLLSLHFFHHGLFFPQGASFRKYCFIYVFFFSFSFVDLLFFLQSFLHIFKFSLLNFRNIPAEYSFYELRSADSAGVSDPSCWWIGIICGTKTRNFWGDFGAKCKKKD